MMSMIQLALFDLAGTSITDNDDVAKVFIKTLHDYSIHCSIEEINTVMGIPKSIAISNLLFHQSAYNNENSSDLIDEIYHSFIINMKDHYTSIQPVTSIQNIEDLFTELYNHGIKIYFDTGFPREITDMIIDVVGWKNYDWYTGVITADDVENGRPAPDMIYKVMSICSIESSKAIVKIGDTPSDMKEGVSANCAAIIGVTYGSHSEHDLINAGSTHIAHSVQELSTLILTLHNDN